ncbi:OLC1v1026916C1 [Oldenlandia corymbosa var. corymbosa]|uniref:OLC1v1026916C1 n=1 Tax=Oldenlandia corymbosa var. corymbosa TaxID=529605 RepID=A0AAV1C8G3_OLDCO|nr:OLC1v1026916C1 [Oldenlandia corymbosa var. corymbosa]
MANERFTHGLLPPNCTLESAEKINLHSLGGIFQENDSVFDHALTRLQLQLVIIFGLTQSLHLLLRRLHLPRICSEILAGIILGPTVLGNYKRVYNGLFPPEGDIFLDILSKIGYIYYIFLSGVKMDPRVVLTSSAGSMTAWTVGVLSPLIPFTGGAALILAIKYSSMFNIHRYHLPAVRSIVSTSVLFPFPVIASLLIDLKIMNSELGRLTLASALISDLISNFMATVAANIKMGSGYKDGMTASSVILFIGWCCLIVGSAGPFARWIIKQTPEGKPMSRVFTILISGAVLLAVILTDNAGINYLYGPFLLGLALPDGPPLGSTLVEKLETIACGLLTPLLVTYCSMRVNLVELYDLDFIWRVWALIGFCLVMKFASVLFPALMCKVPFKDALSLSFIMCTQGVIQIAFYFTFSTSQLFDRETLSMVTSSVFLIATITQLSVKALYDYSSIYTGYHKRDIQHIACNAELRVLTCAHRLDDVLAVKRVLEASFPNKESPLAVYGLSLMELVGRASPVLIDHQLGQKASSAGIRSQKIIEVFHQLEQQFMGLVSMQLYTAVSMPRFMHHDICSLAFDKLAAFIILPFHRRWNNQGKLTLDSSSIRITNCNVCDMAPCSVGILVDRHRMKRQSPISSVYNVAVIFIGGGDDREALSYGKRMARSPGMHLTVIRFVPWDSMGDNQWDAIFDVEILKDTRMQATHQDNIVYREERVKDGAETALQIHSLVETFDLIMVGRRHREDSPQLLGLNEWSELPELGPVGDMLAATEISRPVSVMVVQQQIVRKR